jgi:signal transduction histidine kinase/HAMP domain-containing protein
MPLRLTTKFTLISSLLMLFVAVAISIAYIAQITRLAIRRTELDDIVAADQVLLQAQRAVTDAAAAGSAPASASPQDLHDFLQRALEDSQGLSSEMDAVLGNYPAVYEVSIADSGGAALVSSDPAMVGRELPLRSPFSDLTKQSIYEQLRVILGATQLYQVRAPFSIRVGDRAQPYGEVRVTVETGLLRTQIIPGLRAAGLLALAAVLISTFLVGVVSRVMLRPLTAINKQLDSYYAGQFDAAVPDAAASTTDELGQVSSKITRLGEQLRGVREIFSTLRENLNQVMSGLEDGLILFTQDGRAVLVSPAVQKFLGAPANQFLGKPATEIFPPDHPLRHALRFDGDRILPIEDADLELAQGSTPGGPHRVGVSVQTVGEAGETSPDDWGALVTLRDLESRERIGSELEVSERLSAIGRITAGVAHEVKNPLNSMRLWLENLKESLPADGAASREAVRVLDNEIDRLDRVVKRFLDFSRPVEMHVEDTSLAQVIGGVLSLARPQIERAGVRVHAELPDALPDVRGDRELLGQAVLNIVLNAVEAMTAGGDLRILLEKHGDNALLQISDTGKGIPPEQRSRVFQLFFTTRKGGSGLGLATAYRIVQLHNGSIDFDSEVGRGTTFRIELPFVRGQVSAARRWDEIRSERAAANG